MSERTDGLGTPVGTIHFEGADYTFGLITEGVMGRMEQRLYALKLADLAELRPLLSPEQFEARLAALERRKAEYGFSFESDEMAAYLQTIRGAVGVIALLMAADEDVVMRMMQSPQRDAVNAAFKASYRQSLPAPPKGTPGPKAKARR